MSQHGPAFVGDVQDVPVAFLALLVFDGSVGYLAVFFPVVAFLREMYDNVFYPVEGLGVEEIDRISGSGEMTVHAVGHEALLVIHMRGRLPGIECGLNFVACRAEMGRRCARHCIIGDAENGKSDKKAKNDE
jgi:hypothetical protein